MRPAMDPSARASGWREMLGTFLDGTTIRNRRGGDRIIQGGHYAGSKQRLCRTRRTNPINRQRRAVFGRALETQRPQFPRSAHHFNLAPRDDLSALDALAFVVERIPCAKLVEPAEEGQLVRDRDLQRSKGSHARKIGSDCVRCLSGTWRFRG